MIEDHVRQVAAMRAAVGMTEVAPDPGPDESGYEPILYVLVAASDDPLEFVGADCWDRAVEGLYAAGVFPADVEAVTGMDERGYSLPCQGSVAKVQRALRAYYVAKRP